jgi:glycosyltransferase involved in cell wall biosynthesis
MPRACIALAPLTEPGQPQVPQLAPDRHGREPQRRAPLRIGVVAHLRHPIRSPFMGGMEAHTHRLTQLLLARGHQVTLVASGDSDAALPIRAAIPAGYESRFPSSQWHDTPALHDWLDGEWSRIGELLASLDVDVLHNNSLHPEPLRVARDHRIPMVTTLHVPPFHTLHRAVREITATWMLTTLPSRVQVPRWWDAPPATMRVVPNGIDLGRWRYERHGDGSAVWHGRIAPNKAPALAVQAARRAAIPLMLYGGIEDAEYFGDAVAPLLGGGVRYGGHLSGDALVAAIGRASAALFTPMWDEPFGLAAVEAMACGLPVAAFDNGAAREVIGECGSLAAPGDVAGLADALSLALAIPRGECRARAEARFGEAGMIAAYEQAYTEAIEARG